eukprot:1027466-Pyramimonas_sp.AAC.1
MHGEWTSDRWREPPWRGREAKMRAKALRKRERERERESHGRASEPGEGRGPRASKPDLRAPPLGAVARRPGVPIGPPGSVLRASW